MAHSHLKIYPKQTAAAQLRSERQFRILADSIPQLAWMAEADGRIFWFNNRWYDYTGLCPEALADWPSALDPESEPAARRHWAECLSAGTPIETEYQLRGRDGRLRPFLTRIVPLRDSDKRIYGWVGTHVEISEQRRREEHIRQINAELSHRTKNLLAVVMAMASQTARGTDDVGEFQARFAERLRALQQCHDLLVRDNWQGASFEDLVAAQLEPFGEASIGRFRKSGPPVMLKPEAVQNIGLALHELATNALKYGALSVPEGEVSIEWSSMADRLRVDWRESGGPLVRAPERRGFGHVVLERGVPQALGGEATLDFAPSGVTWTLEFPARPAGCA